MRFANCRRGLCLTGLVALLGIGGQTARAEFPAELGAVDKPVVWVDFWASWCAPCRRSFPWMNAMHEKYADQGLEIIAVNVDKERQLADEFLAETPAEFRLHFDPEGSLAQRFDVQAMPSSFILDGDGTVLAKHFGFRLGDTDEYERQIEKALGLDGEAPRIQE
jgi:thiol-disulfide isomerase/thioredoxin